jgi:hypothetical protein
MHSHQMRRESTKSRWGSRYQEQRLFTSGREGRAEKQDLHFSEHQRWELPSEEQVHEFRVLEKGRDMYIIVSSEHHKNGHAHAGLRRRHYLIYLT